MIDNKLFTLLTRGHFSSYKELLNFITVERASYGNFQLTSRQLSDCILRILADGNEWHLHDLLCEIHNQNEGCNTTKHDLIIALSYLATSEEVDFGSKIKRKVNARKRTIY